jgi:adenosylmethionine-8-amino-7-oxononanoate aminotransferase
MKPRALFITGADTSVGKTMVSALLALALDADYWKPVQSGARDEDETSTVAALTGLPPERLHAPVYSLAEPLSPHEAARRDRVVLRLERIVPPESPRMLLVEGAGGILAPLRDGSEDQGAASPLCMADLARHLGTPVLVVARSGLGTLNHTLLTLEALERRGLRVLGIVLNGPPHPENRMALERLARVPVLAEIPTFPDLQPEILTAFARGADDPFQRVREAFCAEMTREQQSRTGERHIWRPFTQAENAPPPIKLVAASGSRLFAEDGRVFEDLVSSWWVTTHGHCHPAIAGAVSSQANTLDQALFADFSHAPAERLAEALCARLPASLTRVFYSDDGSTAVEVALKMAHQYWRNRLGPDAPPRDRFIAMQGGYHGDTVGALSLGFSSGFYDGFQSLAFSVDFAPFPATWIGDQDAPEKEAEALEALKMLFEDGQGRIAALLMEPLLQGASGMRVCRAEFVRAVAELARAHGALLIFDEVMTGFGRTGAFFAMERAGVTPDIVCLSKCLTGGFLPLAATVASEEIYDAFRGPTFERAFAHGHSYTANPLGCAAGLASLELFEKEGTLERIATINALHRARLARLSGAPFVARTRTLGVMAAVELTGPERGYDARLGRRLKRFFLERGLFVRPLGQVFYLLPPYCVSDATLRRAYDTLEEALANDALFDSAGEDPLSA